MPSSLISLNHACMSCCRHSHGQAPLISAFLCSTNSYSTPTAGYNSPCCRSSGGFSRMRLSARNSTQTRSFATTSNPSHDAAHRNARDDSTRPSRHPTQHSHRNALPYPFPTHANPTPYEIFHLPVGTTQSAIKSRYYDLVRLYHPDAPHCRSLNLTPHVARSRFQAITAAYDALKNGRASVLRPTTTFGFRPRPRSDLHGHPSRAHGYTHARGFNAEWAGMGTDAQEPGDDRWKDRLIIAVGLGAIAVTLSPLFSLAFIPGTLAAHEGRHRSAAQNLAAARREAKHVRWGREKGEDVEQSDEINENGRGSA